MMPAFAAALATAAVAEQSSRILAIDPGSSESAYVVLAAGGPIDFGKITNEQLLVWLRDAPRVHGIDVLVIEEIVTTYGKPVGREVFQAVRWSGRFEQVAGGPVVYIPRKTVVTHLCGTAKAGDSDVLHALKERFGGSTAVGLKAAPGPLYGVHHDVWQALALAVVYAEMHPEESR